MSATTAGRIQRTGGQDRLVVSGLDKIDEPASLVELRGLVDALLPRVDLPELLLEVNAWRGFASQFTHLSEHAEYYSDTGEPPPNPERGNPNDSQR